MAEQGPIDISVENLAKLLRIDKRTVQKHASAGILVKLRHGRYDLAQSVGNYCEHLQKMAAGRQGRDGEVDAVTENALLKRAHRETMELRKQQFQGSLVSIPELEELWGVIIRGIRSMVIGWPNRVAFELPHLTPHDMEVMRRISSDALKAVSRFETLGPLPEPPTE